MFEDKKILRKADIIFGVILILASSFFLYHALKMPRTSDVLRTTSAREAILTAPGLMPTVVCITLIALGLLLIYGALKEGAMLTSEDFANFKGWFKKADSKNTFIMFAIFIVYTFVFLGRLPYAVSTFVYLAAFMFVFKATSLKMIILISAVTTVAIAISFGYFVMIPLP